jgi:hypothetical protein
MDAETPKKVRGYYLREEIMAWLDKEAKAEDRSASFYLDRMLWEIMIARLAKKRAVK